MASRILELTTSYGPGRAHVNRPRGARGALVLGHGAGGGVGAPDLQAAARAAERLRFAVALVEQPYRVAGRRSPPPAAQLDTVWVEVVAQLRRAELRRLRLVTGGRSSGARVACRTAGATRAAGVLCLAFPLRPPGRRDAPDRLPELDSVTVPTLVVQGERDPFGVPRPGPAREVVLVRGDHGLRAADEVEAAVGAWLERWAAGG